MVLFQDVAMDLCMPTVECFSVVNNFTSLYVMLPSGNTRCQIKQIFSGENVYDCKRLVVYHVTKYTI